MGHLYFHTRICVSLYFSICIPIQESPVPFVSLFYDPVTSTPTAACPVNRFPTSLSQRSHKTLVLAAPVSINDASSVLHFRSASQNTTDSIMYRLFLIRSIPWLLTTAPMGVLQPAPVCRLRKAFFHLTKSISAPLMKSSGIQDALCVKLLLSVWTASYF